MPMMRLSLFWVQPEVWHLNQDCYMIIVVVTAGAGMAGERIECYICLYAVDSDYIGARV